MQRISHIIIYTLLPSAPRRNTIVQLQLVACMHTVCVNRHVVRLANLRCYRSVCLTVAMGKPWDILRIAPHLAIKHVSLVRNIAQVPAV